MDENVAVTKEVKSMVSTTPLYSSEPEISIGIYDKNI
jgi:hypothetical protein